MKSDKDKKEWLSEYPSLRQVNDSNPFTVPPGYFDGLSERIISRVFLDKLKESNDSSGGFIVPGNYFEQLSENIQSRINIDSFVNEEDAGFSVPENYFEELSDQIQSRIAVESVTPSENNDFTVPENYFEDLSAQIQSRIFVEEALENKADGFTVPDLYFDKLNQAVINKTIAHDAIKRRGIVRKLMSSAAFKYASAACLALIVGAGIFIRQVNSPQAEHNRSYLHKELSTISSNDIESYLQLHSDVVDTHTIINNDANSVDAQSLGTDLQDYLDSNNQ